eukprot:TRINITY_DN460_c0_g1_i1.p1 TRINITY_DN460_c0_g1~~TRINITY_DN460_c0_g1_i1.p1  ORF type:complete len:170 (-),score=38.91 TRINITY_DN460_c0_g1_i1:103-612(-)
MSFWGAKTNSAKALKITEQDLEGPVTITRAALAFGTRAVLSLKFDNQSYVLATLTKSGDDSASLEINLAETFPVVFAVEGDGEVHLTGYYQEPDPDMFSGESDEEEEDEEEDEELRALLEKRKEETLKATKKNVAVPAAVQEAKGGKRKGGPAQQQPTQNQPQKKRKQK